MKAATEAVYTKHFCENVLYPVGFDESAGDNILFKEINGVLHINGNIGGMGILSEMPDQITVKTKEKETQDPAPGAGRAWRKRRKGIKKRLSLFCLIGVLILIVNGCGQEAASRYRRPAGYQ